MTTLGRLIAISMICATVAFGTAQSASPPFSISLAAPSATVKAGDVVWVKIQLTNTSHHDLSVPVNDVNGVDANYNYEVRAADGKVLEKAARQHPEIQIGSFRSRTLKPGESTAWQEERVSVIYGMTRPGRYLIQVSRPVSEKPKAGVVKSNTITITVTE